MDNTKEPISTGRSGPLTLNQSNHSKLLGIRPTQYNFIYALQISGAVQADQIRSALSAVCRRHESLRTIIRAEGEERRQEVLERFEPELPELEAIVSSPESVHERIREICDQELSIPFDPARRPPWRSTFVRTGKDRCIVLFTCSHIVLDRWALGILLWELMDLLCAARSGKPSLLPPVGMQPIDYAPIQVKKLETTLDARTRAWEQEFSGHEPQKQLATRPAPSGAKGIHHRISELLPEEVVKPLRKRAESIRASFFGVLCTAFSLAWAECTGQSDLMGTFLIAGRDRTDLFNCISSFMDGAILRFRAEPGATFFEHAKTVSSSLLKPMVIRQPPAVLQLGRGCRFLLNYQCVPPASVRGLPGTSVRIDLNRFMNQPTRVDELGLVFNETPILHPSSFLELGDVDLSLYFRDIHEAVLADFWYRADAEFTNPAIPAFMATFREILRAAASDSEFRFSPKRRSPV